MESSNLYLLTGNVDVDEFLVGGAGGREKRAKPWQEKISYYCIGTNRKRELWKIIYAIYSIRQQKNFDRFLISTLVKILT